LVFFSGDRHLSVLTEGQAIIIPSCSPSWKRHSSTLLLFSIGHRDVPTAPEKMRHLTRLVRQIGYLIAPPPYLISPRGIRAG
jgi:hypothetical protein